MHYSPCRLITLWALGILALHWKMGAQVKFWRNFSYLCVFLSLQIYFCPICVRTLCKDLITYKSNFRASISYAKRLLKNTLFWSRSGRHFNKSALRQKVFNNYSTALRRTHERRSYTVRVAFCMSNPYFPDTCPWRVKTNGNDDKE